MYLQTRLTTGGINRRHRNNGAPVDISLITLYIIVEDEAGDIDLPNILVIHFKLYRRIYDTPHMTAIFSCTPLALAPAQPSTCASPASEPKEVPD